MGIVLALVVGRGIENLVKQFIPLAPMETILSPSAAILFQSLMVGAVVGVLGGLYPAWVGSRMSPATALRH